MLLRWMSQVLLLQEISVLMGTYRLDEVDFLFSFLLFHPVALRELLVAFAVVRSFHKVTLCASS